MDILTLRISSMPLLSSTTGNTENLDLGIHLKPQLDLSCLSFGTVHRNTLDCNYLQKTSGMDTL